MASSSGTDENGPTAMNRAMSSPIVVCMKWVALRPEIDPLTGSVVTDERWSGPSLADQAALEWALRLAETRATTAHVITVATAAADAMLRDALAAGATAATRIHLDDGDEHQPSSACIARLLADVARSLDPQMVLCGDWSLDRGSASVPSFLAAELSLDAVCGLVRIEQTGAEHLQVERRLDGGRREVLAVTGPAVLSVEGTTARLRRAPLRGVLHARTAAVAVVAVGAADLEWEPAPQRVGPFRPRARILDAPLAADPRQRVEALTHAHTSRTPPQRLALDPDAAADMILDHLRAWGQLPG